MADDRTRRMTKRLYEMIENEAVSPDTVITACLKYMSEQDVEDMMHLNGFCVDDAGNCDCATNPEPDEDDDEDEESTP